MTTPELLQFTPERVKRIRVELGEDQETFAQRIGVHTNSVSRYERGEATPTEARVIKALLAAERETSRDL